jgi:hypothetical protein
MICPFTAPDFEHPQSERVVGEGIAAEKSCKLNEKMSALTIILASSARIKRAAEILCQLQAGKS